MSACPYCLTDCGHPETCGAELDEQPIAWRRHFATKGTAGVWPSLWITSKAESIDDVYSLDEPEHHIEPPC